MEISEIGRIANRWADHYRKHGESLIPGAAADHLALAIKEAINEATEELVGNVDILKGEVKHLETLCTEKDREIVECGRRIAELEEKLQKKEEREHGIN